MLNSILVGLNLPVALLAVHTFADFRCQNDWMAINKSKRLDALALHVLIYTVVFMLYGFYSGWTGEVIRTFGIITFCTHFLTDFFTSRLSRRVFPWLPLTAEGPDQKKSFAGRTLYEDMDGINGRSRNRFFNVLGVDQLIHFFTLALTYRLLIE